MNNFYQPLQATSFLTLRTNTQIFKPPSSAFRRPVLLSDGRVASRLPLQIQPDFDPEIPQEIIAQMIGQRSKEDASIPKVVEPTKWANTAGGHHVSTSNVRSRHATTAPISAVV